MACGFVSAARMPSDAEVHRLYDERYFHGVEYEDYVRDRRCARRNFDSRLRVLRSFLQPTRHRHLFEVGSAYGFFLDLARREFETVRGIDVTGAGTRFARDTLRLDVLTDDFLQYDFGAARFDVVCLWDTIEHLRSPGRYVQKIADHTESGALLAVTTGDIGSLNARMRRGSWRLIHPPTHLHYFSRATLGRLLRRHGFDVVYSRACGFWRSARGAAYALLVLRQRRPELFARLERAGLVDFDFYLNLFDIMFVIARRR